MDRKSTEIPAFNGLPNRPIFPKGFSIVKFTSVKNWFCSLYCFGINILVIYCTCSVVYTNAIITKTHKL